MVINCGVTEIHYLEGYPDDLSAEMLAEAGVTAAQGGAPIEAPLEPVEPPAHRGARVPASPRRIVYLLTPLMGRLARRTGAVDNPTDDRRMHVLATPLLGGLGMYLGWMIPVMLLVESTARCGASSAAPRSSSPSGSFDDLYELEPIVKFMGQLLAIGVAIYFDIRIEHMSIPFTRVMLHFPLRLSVAGHRLLDGDDRQHGELHRRPRRPRRRRLRHLRAHLLHHRR